MPATGTKLYTHRSGVWRAVYAELFADAEKQQIFNAFDASLDATGFVPEAVWGERVEDRGSQITFSALGQEAPIQAKEKWDPDFAKRKIIQRDLRQRLPGLSINMGGATSIDITREGVDKAYGLTKLRDASGIALGAMLFIGDAIFPGGNDYPAKTLGLDTVCVRDPRETRAVIETIIACLQMTPPCRRQAAAPWRPMTVAKRCGVWRHDLPQSFRSASGRLQGQPLEQGAVRQPLHGVRGRDDQIARLALANEWAAGLRPAGPARAFIPSPQVCRRSP